MTARYGRAVNGKLVEIFDGKSSVIEINGERIPYKYLPIWEKVNPEEFTKRSIVSLDPGDPPKVDDKTEIAVFVPAEIGAEAKHSWEVQKRPVTPEPSINDLITQRAQQIVNSFFQPIFDHAQRMQDAADAGLVVDIESGAIDGKEGWPVL